MEKILPRKSSSLVFSEINRWVLLAYLFFLPTQLGKHFFIDFSFINGIRVDYLAPTAYFLDGIFLLLVCLNIKSLIKFFSNKVFLILVFLLFFNAAFSLNFWLALNKSLRIWQWLTVFFLFKKNQLPPKSILLTLFFSSLIQLFLAVYQFISGHAFQGIFYFLGERYFHLGTIGIAKIVFSGKEFLRSYGTFSHPNSLAGFYLLLYTFLLTEKVQKQDFLLKNVLLLIFTVLVFISFSKAAIAVLIFITLIFQLRQKSFCRICVIARLLVLIVCGGIFFLGQTDPLSLAKRIELSSQALKIIKYHLLFGVGLNNYLLAQTNFNSRYFGLFNQPVHNLFLLVFAEIGLLDLGLLTIMIKNHLWKLLKKNYLLILAIVLTGMVDHYWWSLTQNFFLTAVVFGISLKKS